jgi:hypothetical protein
MVGLAACAESFGAVCMLCAERLTILPIGCIIGQKNLFAQSPVLHRCSWRASSLGTKKKCTTISPQFHRHFLRLWGPQSPPLPPACIYLQLSIGNFRLTINAGSAHGQAVWCNAYGGRAPCLKKCVFSFLHMYAWLTQCCPL